MVNADQTTGVSKIAEYSKICNWIIVGCLILLVFAGPATFNPGANEPFMPYKELACQLLVGLFLSACIVRFAASGFHGNIKNNYVLWFMAAFFALNLASFFWAVNTFEARKEIQRQFYFVSMAAAACLLITESILAKRHLKAVFIAALIAAGAIAIHTIIEYYDIQKLQWLIFYKSPGRLLSLFGYQNLIAQYMLAVIPFGVALLLDIKKKKWRIPIAVLLLSCIYCLVITWCRGAWIGLYVAMWLFAFLIACGRGRQYKIGVLITGAIVLLSALGYVYARYNAITAEEREQKHAALWREGVHQQVGTQFSREAFFLRGDSERLDTWKNAMSIFKKNKQHVMFGVGAGNWRVQFLGHKPQLRGNIGYVHNDYIQILVDLGFIGFLAFTGILFFIWAYFKDAFAAAKDNGGENNETRSVYVIAIASSLAGAMAHMIFSFNTQTTISGMFFWLCAGLLAGFAYKGRMASGTKALPSEEQRIFSRSPKKVLVSLIVGITIAAFLTAFTAYSVFSKLGVLEKLDKAAKLHVANNDKEANEMLAEVVQTMPDPVLIGTIAALRLGALKDKYQFLLEDPNSTGEDVRAAMRGEKKNIDSIIFDLKTAADQLPYEPQTHYNLANAYLFNADYENAEKTWLNLLKFCPMHAGAREQLAELYYMRHDLDSAIAQYVRLVKLTDEYIVLREHKAVYNLQLGKYYAENRNYASALRHFMQCNNEMVNYPDKKEIYNEAHFRLCDALLNLDKPEEAYTKLEMLVNAIDPRYKNPDHRHLMRRILKTLLLKETKPEKIQKYKDLLYKISWD